MVAQGAATASTSVVLHTLGAANAAVTNGTFVVATGGAGTSGTAFGAAAQSQNIGFVNYVLTTSTIVGVTSFALVRTPGTRWMVEIKEGAQNLWYKSADAWASHAADLRVAKWCA